ncbi:MAG: transporter [Halioglobus sp.]
MKITLSVFFVVAMLLASMSGAQELTPRAYWPAPKGTRVATIGYSYVTGDIIPDPSLPLTGVDSTIGSLTLGYLQTIDLWGRTANVIVELPYSDGDTVGTGNFGENLKREYQGMGDVSATLSVNFLGAPSMTPPEFAELLRDPGLIIGGSLKLVAPTGRYDSDRLINVGANRWAMKAELGVIAPIREKWLLEVDLGGWFFADNDDFLGFTKEQDPIAGLQVHLVHIFNRGFWASLDTSFYTGGRSKVGDRRLDDLQRDSKLGLTLVYPMGGKQALKVGYSMGSVNDNDEDFDVFILAYSKGF